MTKYEYLLHAIDTNKNHISIKYVSHEIIYSLDTIKTAEDYI